MERKNFKVLYGFIILVLYLVFGILLIFKYLIGREEPNISFGLFGFVVIGYGIFRAYRGYKEYKTQDKENG